MTKYTYKYRDIPAAVIVEVFDESGARLGEALGFGKKDAKKQAKLKLGLVKEPEIGELSKITKNEKKGRVHVNKRSVMTGLNGVTSSKNWKHTK